jgi:hypothetical protein
MGDKQTSFWQVFYDDLFVLFVIAAAIYFALYTVWGLMELGTVGISPLMN